MTIRVWRTVAPPPAPGRGQHVHCPTRSPAECSQRKHVHRAGKIVFIHFYGTGNTKVFLMYIRDQRRLRAEFQLTEKYAQRKVCSKSSPIRPYFC